MPNALGCMRALSNCRAHLRYSECFGAGASQIETGSILCFCLTPKCHGRGPGSGRKRGAPQRIQRQRRRADQRGLQQGEHPERQSKRQAASDDGDRHATPRTACQRRAEKPSGPFANRRSPGPVPADAAPRWQQDRPRDRNLSRLLVPQNVAKAAKHVQARSTDGAWRAAGGGRKRLARTAGGAPPAGARCKLALCARRAAAGRRAVWRSTARCGRGAPRSW